MADTTSTKKILSLIATTSSKIRSLTIKSGQLIFIQDLGRIAFDFNGQRVFYNQIVELDTEAERLALETPLSGYYFILGTGVLWYYGDEWAQITSKPEDIVFIGTSLPQLGQAKENTLYVNKAEREIAVFDSASNEYIIVSDYTREATDSDIENLFN